MAPRSRGPATRPAWEVAPDVFCVGPWGRTQTVVYFVRSGPAWMLVDAGWAGDGPRIAEAGQYLFGSAHPVAIVLTHCHPDHAGAARWLAATWNCPVYMHPEELPIAAGDFAVMKAVAKGPLDRWMIMPLMRAVGPRRREAILAKGRIGAAAHPLAVGQGLPGLPEWQWLPTPGHTPGHLAFFRPSDRVLVSGDALVTLRVNSVAGIVLGRPGLSGPPWYTTWNQIASRESLRRLAALHPTVIAGGHGAPLSGGSLAEDLRRFVDGDHAEERRRGRLDARVGFGLSEPARSWHRKAMPGDRPSPVRQGRSRQQRDPHAGSHEACATSYDSVTEANPGGEAGVLGGVVELVTCCVPGTDEHPGPASRSSAEAG